jgi:hypothetical protein
MDAGLADIIDKARQKKPDERFASAREFHDALARWSEGARREIAGGATLPLTPPAVASPGGDTALAGGAGLAAREVIPARAAAEVSATPASATVPFSPPAEPVALGNRTGQAWANTQALQPEEPKKRSGRNVMISGGAAVALAVIVLVVKLQSDTASSAAQAAATSASVGRQLQEVREEAAQKLAEEQARTRELEAKQEARRQEMERAQAAAAQERAAEEERRLAEAAKAKPEAQRPQRPPATRAPAPSRSSSAPAGGRRIRTSL